MILRYSWILIFGFLPILSGAETTANISSAVAITADEAVVAEDNPQPATQRNAPPNQLLIEPETQQPVEPVVEPVAEDNETTPIDTAPAIEVADPEAIAPDIAVPTAEDDLESPEFQAYLEQRKTAPDVERVRILLEISGTAAAAQKMLSELINSLAQTQTNVPANVWDDMQQAVTKEAVLERIVPIYQQHYSQQDLEVMLNFYASAVGQRFVKKQPLVAQQAFEVSQQWAAELAKQALENTTTEVDAVETSAE